MKNEHRGVKREREDPFEPEKYGLASALFGEDLNMFDEVVAFFEPHEHLQCYDIFNNCEAFLDMFDFVVKNPGKEAWGSLCGIAEHRFWSLKQPDAYSDYFDDFPRNGWETLDGKEVKACMYDSDDGPLSVVFHWERQMVGLIIYSDGYGESLFSDGESYFPWASTIVEHDVIGVQDEGGHSVYHYSFLYATTKQVVYVDTDNKKRYVLLDTKDSSHFSEDQLETLTEFHAGEAYGNHTWHFEVTSSSGKQLRFELQQDPGVLSGDDDSRVLITLDDKPNTPIRALIIERPNSSIRSFGDLISTEQAFVPSEISSDLITHFGDII